MKIGHDDLIENAIQATILTGLVSFLCICLCIIYYRIGNITSRSFDVMCSMLMVNIWFGVYCIINYILLYIIQCILNIIIYYTSYNNNYNLLHNTYNILLLIPYCVSSVITYCILRNIEIHVSEYYITGIDKPMVIHKVWFARSTPQSSHYTANINK
ncbi:hypothetical protein NEIRO03_2541 [Nematocida sp. AWRm78]|nr:hypothetical protein NEIRO02_2537 [Nematocida sp. AWRm79]KAI5187460.1 hypothetical protein NEIRO03_2541 [Nematocida sp. AWRm78]